MCVSADNPASCSLGGFKESTAAYRPCRQCLGSKGDIKSEFRASNFFFRTPDSHKKHVEDLEDPNKDYSSLSKEFGVNHR